jgi:hypothetical protein
MSIVKDSSIAFPTRYFCSTQDYFPDGSTNGPADVSNTTRTVKAVRTREGQRLPGWKGIIKAGGNATTPLSGVFDNIWSRQLSVKHKWVNNNDGSFRITIARGDVTFAFIAPAGDGSMGFGTMIDTSAADNRARARFYKRLRAQQVQFSGPTFLGELRETLRMIKQPAQAIRDSCDRYYRSLKQWRGRNRPPANSHRKWQWRQELEKVAGGLWLENSFGWQPLIHDIEDAVKAFEKLTPPISNVVGISVGDTDGIDSYNAYSATGFGDSQSHLNIGSMMFYMYLDFARSSCTVRYKGKISTQTEATRWDDLALFGFTPSEFIPTAWELLPWSFLIDYFTNIGDILTSAVTRTTPVHFVNSTIRKTARLYGRLVSDPRRPGGFPWDWTLAENTGSSAQWEIQRKSISRQAGGGVSLPSLQFESGLNVGQMCNITALLTNFLDVHPQDKPRRNWHR